MPRHHVLKRRNPPPQSRRKESCPQSPQCSKKEAPQAEELSSLRSSANRWVPHLGALWAPRSLRKGWDSTTPNFRKSEKDLASHQSQRIYIHNQVAPRNPGTIRMRQHPAQRRVQRLARPGLQNQMETVHAFDARDRRCARAQHTHTSAVLVLDELLAKKRRPPRRLFQLRRLHQHIRQHAERRIVHPAPVLQLPLRKARVVVSSRSNNRVVLWIVSLHHHTPRQIATPRTPCDLRH